MENQWEALSCICGNASFVEKIEIRWKKDGGIVKRPNGFVCSNCRVSTDGEKLITRKQREQKERELEELKAQIG